MIHQKVLSYVYSSVVLLALYKTFKALLRLLLPFLFGRSEVYRLCDAELKTSKSPGLGSITGLQISTDSETIVSWRNGIGRAVVAPRVSPYTLLRIDQAILYSSKLTVRLELTVYSSCVW